MKNTIRWLSLLLVMVIAVGCIQAEPTAIPPAPPTIAPTAAPAEPTAPAPVVLTVEGLDGTTISLTLEEVKALPAVEAWGGSMSSTGRITPPALHKGVAVEELCALVGGLAEGMAVRIEADDGYAMTISYDQIVNGAFTVYDPGTGKETTTDDTLRVVLTYEREGAPLSEREEGILRLGMLNNDQMQVTDGHWWVKWVNRVTIKPLEAEWTLHLDGTITEEMDRATFESGAAPHCHLYEWQDGEGQTWSGIPLWLLVGRVDDDNPHEDKAFNRAMIDAGYSVDVVAADGYTVSFDSARFALNDDLIVAYLLDGSPLPEEYFPLRLVGEGIEKGEMIAQIAQIVVHPPEVTAPEPPAEPTAEAQPALPAAAALQITGRDGSTVAFTMAELQALPATEGWAGFKNSTGRIFPPLPYKGVAMTDLAAQVGALSPEDSVRVIAEDGYEMTFTYEQIADGAFTTYDPESGESSAPPGELHAIIAYEEDGKPMAESGNGALRLVIVGDAANQVTDGHWWAKFVNQIVIEGKVQDWTLHLDGTITEEMDRATFESGAAPHCHEAQWTDLDGREWTGIPLWLLAGRVDDDNNHKGKAFNRELADAGYTIDVSSADGYTATFDSARVKENAHIIVAYLVDGKPLGERDFPLRLVGDDLANSEMVGQIASIVVNLPEETAAPEPTVGPTPKKAEVTAPEDTALIISGAVENELALSLEDLRVMEVSSAEIEHPKRGMQTYEGVLVSALLEGAKPTDAAQSIVFTAADGYSAEASVADVQACASCMVAFEGEVLNMVMPDLQSNFWVKGVVGIEVK